MTHQAATAEPAPRRRWGVPAQTVAVTVVLTGLGLDMVIRSARWYKTPAYGNLLKIMSADAWGAIYLAVAAAMVLGMVLRTRRPIRVAAHTLAFVLLIGWEFAFGIRAVTDPATTIANVMSWGAYVFLTVWSGQLFDRPTKR